MTKVAILGASGMLGSAVLEQFQTFEGRVVYTTRSTAQREDVGPFEHRHFDAVDGLISDVLKDFENGDYVINCIGIIKPYIKDSEPKQRKTAQLINGLFPHSLAEFGERTGTRTIQIATDCVYSGKKGNYVESDEFDALDVYGKTKSLGEVPSDSIQHLRASIIGPEHGRSTSLLEWVRNQPERASINGFLDHSWNGVSTRHFGKISRGIIETNVFRPGVQHLVPSDIVSKYKLVSEIARVFERHDISISETISGNPVDRTLQTDDKTYNSKLWNAAGYVEPPTVSQMISEIRD